MSRPTPVILISMLIALSAARAEAQMLDTTIKHAEPDSALLTPAMIAADR